MNTFIDNIKFMSRTMKANNLVCLISKSASAIKDLSHNSVQTFVLIITVIA